jgi:hypothetical protein
VFSLFGKSEIISSHPFFSRIYQESRENQIPEIYEAILYFLPSDDVSVWIF